MIDEWVRFECLSCATVWEWDDLRQVQPAGDYWCPACDADGGGLFRLRLHRPPGRIARAALDGDDHG